MQNQIQNIQYEGHDLELAQKTVKWKSYFSKELRGYIKGDVLEVGAGIGTNASFLTKKNNEISSYTLLEPEKNFVPQIQNNISNLNIKAEAVSGTIANVIHRKFDTIIYIDVLEHIQESEQEIKRAKQCLKPNGKLIVLVPAYNFLYSEFDRELGHFRRYDRSLLLREVNSELLNVSLFYLDTLGFLALVINKLFLRKGLPNQETLIFWDKWIIPLSKVFDKLFFKSFGKSLVGIFQNKVD